MPSGPILTLDGPLVNNQLGLNLMQALILAGGQGTRLRSIVQDRPKAMACVGEKPFLELQIQCLKKYDIGGLVLCVGHLHQQIQDYFGDGGKWGVRISYSVEDGLLGTGGALKHAEMHLRGRFLALNGDSYLDLDLRKLVQFHEAKKAKNQPCLGTVALTTVPDSRDFGSVRIDQENRILSFEEKSEDRGAANHISAGIYVLEPDLLTLIPPCKNTSLERETFPAVLKAGFLLFGYPVEGFFADIGTPEGYRRFQDYMKRRPQ